MKVMIVKELMTGDVSPVAMFYIKDEEEDLASLVTKFLVPVLRTLQTK